MFTALHNLFLILSDGVILKLMLIADQCLYFMRNFAIVAVKRQNMLRKSCLVENHPLSTMLSLKIAILMYSVS